MIRHVWTPSALRRVHRRAGAIVIDLPAVAFPADLVEHADLDGPDIPSIPWWTPPPSPSGWKWLRAYRIPGGWRLMAVYPTRIPPLDACAWLSSVLAAAQSAGHRVGIDMPPKRADRWWSNPTRRARALRLHPTRGETP